MPINPNLLIAAPMLQDYLVDDATGLPLAAGTITMYQDNSRTTLKNWYYQSGSPGAYTYITLPNPMILSSVGTIVDNNGNDTIPFYYPVSEVDNSTPQPYYVVVTNSNGQQQFVRQNFPFVPTSGTPGSEVETLQNYITNGEFWRNIGIGPTNVSAPTNTFLFNGDTFYYATLSPSNHDGFSFPDVIFAKNSQDATDNISFPLFPLGSSVLPNGITPEFYFNLNCSGAGTETVKYISFPIQLHIQNLSGVSASLVFWAQNAGGTNNTLAPSILQYLGTGVLSPNPIPLRTLTLTNNWQQYIIPFVFQSALGTNIASASGGPSDDAYYLQFNFPTAQTCNINIANPFIVLGNTVPTNSFQSYDQVDSIINTPRTGDLRTSINSFQPFGWVAANDGTIGSSSSNATTRQNSDTFPLFNLLWNIAKPYANGTSNPICQMFNSGGAATSFGTTAVGDFDANNQLALTRAFGRVMLGTAPISTLLTKQSTTFSASSSSGLLITTANNVNFFNGMPIVFTNTGGALPTGLVANAVYYVANFNGSTTFNVATSFANALAGTVIAFTNAGSGTNTVTSAVVGSSEGEYAHTQLLAEMAAHTHTVTPIGNADSGGSRGHIQQNATNDNQTSTTFNTGSRGSSVPANVSQPGTFYNIYFKL